MREKEKTSIIEFSRKLCGKEELAVEEEQEDLDRKTDRLVESVRAGQI